MWHQLAPYFPVLIAAGLLIWRQSRSQGTRIRQSTMWIAPVLVALAVILLMSAAPPVLTPAVVAGFVAALALGGAVGWLMARHVNLTVDPKTGTVSSKATPVGLILLVALLVARFALKSEFLPAPGQAEGHLQASALLATDFMILFSAGLVWGRVVTLMTRIRPLLEAHRATIAAP